VREEIQRLIDSYVQWLRDKTVLREVGDWVEITTPYLDRHNDYVQIYAQRQNGAYILTDDGYAIEDLAQSGCNLDTPRRQELLRMTLNGFGVQLAEGNRLQVKATPENFSTRKHSLVQSILAVNDMFYTASPIVANLFYEDVVAWLETNEIRYTPSVKFTGKSGYDHLFDFVIPKSRRQPERILQAVSRPSRDMAEVLAFMWIDTKEVRPPDSRAYALLNDTEQRVSSAVSDALKSYDVRPVVWSQREEIRQEFIA
jgi:hypothetical protein